MKFLIQLVAILIAAALLEILLPWWSIAIGAAFGGYFFRSKANFLAGFLAIALLWLIKAMWLETQSASSLTESIASILMIKSKTALFLVTALLGGLVGGFASLTASLIKKP
jgi:hypothetical protein